MININETKKKILEEMINYYDYDEECQKKIASVIANTNVYEWKDLSELLEIKEKENYKSLGSFDSNFICIDKFFYDIVYSREEDCKIVDNQFIALNTKVLDTAEKEIYALVEAYIMAFMSYNTLEKNNRIYSKRRGNMYINYSGDEFGNFVSEKSVSFFEDACTKYDACAITKKICIYASEEDFCIDDRYNTRDFAGLLLDNSSVKNKINYSRINHLLISSLGDESFTKIQTALNEEFINIIVNEYNNNKRMERINELFKNVMPIKEKLLTKYIPQEKQR